MSDRATDRCEERATERQSDVRREREGEIDGDDVLSRMMEIGTLLDRYCTIITIVLHVLRRYYNIALQ